MNNLSRWKDQDVVFALITTAKHIVLRCVYLDDILSREW